MVGSLLLVPLLGAHYLCLLVVVLAFLCAGRRVSLSLVLLVAYLLGLIPFVLAFSGAI